MLANGKYSVWFRTPLGEGTGVVMLKEGAINGSDTVLAYTGSYAQDGDAFTAEITTRRHTPGQLSVFGIDNVDLSVAGKSTPTVASCRGATRQAPIMAFEAILIPIAD